MDFAQTALAAVKLSIAAAAMRLCWMD